MTLRLAVMVVLVASTSCGETGVMVCAAGATQACVCPGGLQGAQVCSTNGESWGVCNGCGTSPCQGPTCNNTKLADPVAACKEMTSAMCNKIYGCLTGADLEALKSVLGANAAECARMMQAENCTADSAKCDAGTSYKPDKAAQCVSDVKSMTCAALMSEDSDGPASCAAVCS